MLLSGAKVEVIFTFEINKVKKLPTKQTLFGEGCADTFIGFSWFYVRHRPVPNMQKLMRRRLEARLGLSFLSHWLHLHSLVEAGLRPL